MKIDMLIDAIGSVDADMLREVEVLRSKKARSSASRLRWCALAACLCLIVAAAFALPRLLPWSEPVPPVATDPTQEATEAELLPGDPGWSWTVNYNDTTAGVQADFAIPGYFTEDLNDEVLSMVKPQVCTDWMDFSGYTAFDGEGELVAVYLDVTTANKHHKVRVLVSERGAPSCEVTEEEPVVSVYNGVEFEVYRYASGSRYLYYEAVARIGKSCFQFIMNANKDDLDARSEFEQILACFTYFEEGQPDASIIVPKEIPPWREDFLTHEEALADPDFGPYMIRELPFGYIDASSRENCPVLRFQNQNFNYAAGQWGRFAYGYYLNWTVNAFDAGYPYWYAYAENLTQEVVETSSKKRVNSANLESWHVDISVCYGDVIVRVESVGLEPAWVYEQLAALKNR